MSATPRVRPPPRIRRRLRLRLQHESLHDDDRMALGLLALVCWTGRCRGSIARGVTRAGREPNQARFWGGSAAAVAGCFAVRRSSRTGPSGGQATDREAARRRLAGTGAACSMAHWEKSSLPMHRLDCWVLRGPALLEDRGCPREGDGSRSSCSRRGPLAIRQRLAKQADRYREAAGDGDRGTAKRISKAGG